jgi:hypothetical protein
VFVKIQALVMGQSLVMSVAHIAQVQLSVD